MRRPVLSPRTIPIVAAFGAATLLLNADPATARRPQEPVLIQVTHSSEGDIERPQIRSEGGDTIVFVSDGDVMGNGTAPGHREVYLYDSLTGVITQVTDSIPEISALRNKLANLTRERSLQEKQSSRLQIQV